MTERDIHYECLTFGSTVTSPLFFRRSAALYARLFGLRHHDPFIACSFYASVVFNVLVRISSTLVFILQCILSPVLWKHIYLLFTVGRTDGPTESYCMDRVTQVVIPVILGLFGRFS
jgi:hypothetical protein